MLISHELDSKQNKMEIPSLILPQISQCALGERKPGSSFCPRKISETLPVTALCYLTVLYNLLQQWHLFISLKLALLSNCCLLFGSKYCHNLQQRLIVKAACACSVIRSSTVNSTLMNQAAQLHFLSNLLIVWITEWLYENKYVQPK